MTRSSPLLESCKGSEKTHAEIVTVGIPRTPWDFLERAIGAGHPRTLAIHLNEAVTKMLHENFAEEPYHVVKTRVLFLQRWTQRCKELTTDEDKLHQHLEPHLRHVLKGKRLLLFKEMLQELQYPDKELVDTICSGFPLTGWLPKSNVFPACLKRPAHSLESACKLAKGVNKSILKQVTEQNDAELADEVWRQSCRGS